MDLQDSLWSLKLGHSAKPQISTYAADSVLTTCFVFPLSNFNLKWNTSWCSFSYFAQFDVLTWFVVFCSLASLASLAPLPLANLRGFACSDAIFNAAHEWSWLQKCLIENMSIVKHVKNMSNIQTEIPAVYIIIFNSFDVALLSRNVLHLWMSKLACDIPSLVIWTKR